MRDCVEVALQVGVDDVGVARFEQFIDSSQCVFASPVGVYSKKTGLDLGITRPGPGEPDRNPLDDAKLAPRLANGSISSSIAWTTSRPPGNGATVSEWRL